MGTNKLMAIAILLCIMLFAGCSSESMTSSMPSSDEQNQSTDSEGTLNLSVGSFTQEITPMSAKSRAEGKLGDTFSQLDVALIPTDGKGSVHKLSQSRSENLEQFGKVSMRIPVGSYKLIAVASTLRGKSVDIVSATEIDFPDNKAVNNAFLCKDIVIKAGNNEISEELTRTVSLLQIASTDDRLADAKFVDVILKGNCSNKLNPTTGLPVEGSTEDIVRSIDISNEPTQMTRPLSIYCFLGSTNEELVEAKISIKNGNKEDSEILKTLTFDGDRSVKLKAGCKTILTGGLFSLSSTLDFKYSQDWGSSGGDQTFLE